ncbi:DUF1223 domain-containing protein [Massilia sp. PWRC2]|uniref:DUF1223 domain-containing protein n=1 Tax=Massilia sp. PWRC2 TaxID=2804626 RepID=UPI003CE86373
MHTVATPALLLVLAAAFCCAPAASAGAVCEATSGRATAALVELYISEGCSSCPPADLQLRTLRRQLDANAVLVPLALHVSYWDQIGWKDVFAQARFDARQHALLTMGRRQVAYTPQFFVNGKEVREWRAALPAEIRRTNARPAPLTIQLQTSTAAATLLLDATVRATVSTTAAPAAGALYLAVSESGLLSPVRRGENSGVTLQHDDTVRLWLGPFALEQGHLRVHQQVPLPAAWRRDRLQAVAFVQGADGRIVQAVSTAQCLAPSAGML